MFKYFRLFISRTTFTFVLISGLGLAGVYAYDALNTQHYQADISGWQYWQAISTKDNSGQLITKQIQRPTQKAMLVTETKLSSAEIDTISTETESLTALYVHQQTIIDQPKQKEEITPHQPLKKLYSQRKVAVSQQIEKLKINDHSVIAEAHTNKNRKSKIKTPSTNQIIRVKNAPVQIVKKTVSHQLPDLDTQNHEHGNMLSQWLAEESTEIGSTLDTIINNSNSPKEYIHSKAINTFRDYVSGQAVDYLNYELNRYGVSQLSLSMDENWKINQYELDYLQPLEKSQSSLTFMQLGARNWQERDHVNLGFGFREKDDLSTYMIGVNTFIDADLTEHHYRMSVGLEYAANYYRLYYNYYYPLSDWKEKEEKIDAVNTRKLEVRAAKGYDIALTGYLPFYNALSSTVEHFNWRGNHLDVDGSFGNNTSGTRFSAMPDTYSGYDLSVEWRPIPLVSAGYTYRFVSSDQTKDQIINLQLTYDFNKSFLKQMIPATTIQDNLLTGMSHSFVRRNNHILLDYRKNKKNGTLINLGSLSQFLGKVAEVSGGQTIIFNGITVTSSLPYTAQWIGVSTDTFNDHTLLNPQFTPPLYKKNSDNKYTLQLKVTEEDGSTTYSDKINISVIDGNEKLHPTIIFYKDAAKKIAIDIDDKIGYKVPVEFDGNQEKPHIYWSIFSNRPEYKKQKANGQNLCDQLDQCQELEWVNDSDIIDFTQPNEIYPAINNRPDAPGINQYRPSIKIKTLLDGDIETKITVEIIASDKMSDIQWEGLGDEKSYSYAYQNEEHSYSHITAQSDKFKDANGNIMGELVYKITTQPNSNLFSIDEKTGKVTIKGIGNFMVEATHSSKDNIFSPTTISYQVYSYPSSENIDKLKWHKEVNDANIGLQTKEVNLKYLYNKNVKSCLTLDGSNCLSKSAQKDSGYNITYSSSDTTIAKFNDRSEGDLTLKHPGKAIISANIRLDNKSTQVIAEFSYQMNIEKNQSTPLEWANPDNNSKLLHNSDGSYYLQPIWNNDSDNTYNPTIKKGTGNGQYSTGELTYSVIPVGTTLANIEPKTGKLTLLSSDITKGDGLMITATQKEDEYYQQRTAKYQVIIMKNKPQLKWIYSKDSDLTKPSNTNKNPNLTLHQKIKMHSEYNAHIPVQSTNTSIPIQYEVCEKNEFPCTTASDIISVDTSGNLSVLAESGKAYVRAVQEITGKIFTTEAIPKIAVKGIDIISWKLDNIDISYPEYSDKDNNASISCTLSVIDNQSITLSLNDELPKKANNIPITYENMRFSLTKKDKDTPEYNPIPAKNITTNSPGVYKIQVGIAESDSSIVWNNAGASVEGELKATTKNAFSSETIGTVQRKFFIHVLPLNQYSNVACRWK